MNTMIRRSCYPLIMMLCLIVAGSSVRASTFLQIKKTEYLGYGNVQVSFIKKAEYKNFKVTVKDKDGKRYKASVLSKNQNYVKFKISNYTAGTSYTYTLSGIREKGEVKYSSLSGKVWIPASKKGVQLNNITYTADSKKVNIQFFNKVDWKKTKVSIKKDGKEYITGITKKEKKGIKLKVKPLTSGKKYTVKISGIRKKGTKKYKTISFSFKAK